MRRRQRQRTALLPAEDKRSYLETSSDRYNATVGLLIEELDKPNKKNELQTIFVNYPNILAVLRDRFPSDTAEWRFIQQSLDTTNSLLSDLSK